MIIYSFLSEIEVEFSNAYLGTQDTKNAAYGLQNGWENLKAIFTGTVEQDDKFIDV